MRREESASTPHPNLREKPPENILKALRRRIIRREAFYSLCSLVSQLGYRKTFAHCGSPPYGKEDWRVFLGSSPDGPRAAKLEKRTWRVQSCGAVERPEGGWAAHDKKRMGNWGRSLCFCPLSEQRQEDSSWDKWVENQACAFFEALDTGELPAEEIERWVTLLAQELREVVPRDQRTGECLSSVRRTSLS